jgi:hypothetical protein
MKKTIFRASTHTTEYASENSNFTYLLYTDLIDNENKQYNFVCHNKNNDCYTNLKLNKNDLRDLATFINQVLEDQP